MKFLWCMGGGFFLLCVFVFCAYWLVQDGLEWNEIPPLGAVLTGGVALVSEALHYDRT